MVDELRAYIDGICKVLDIHMPAIVFASDNFQSASQKAAYDTATDTLTVDISGGDLRDLVFFASHELRHKWQWKYKRELFSGYKERKDCSLEEYNLQPAELDAHAFATVAIGHYFGNLPAFNGLPEAVRNKIYEAAKRL